MDADILADLLPEDRVAAAEVVPIVTARTMAAEDPHAVGIGRPLGSAVNGLLIALGAIALGSGSNLGGQILSRCTAMLSVPLWHPTGW